MDKVELLPVEALIRTGDVDHADWNYRPLLGRIQRLRFECVMELLGGRRFDRLLEVGYGSGVFMPVLEKCCKGLYGVDVHDKADEVDRVLRANGVTPELHQCGIGEMPFGDDFFECIVSVSALEFVEDLEAGCREMARVLPPEGVLVVVTPKSSRILDLGLRLLTGASAEADYGVRRERVLPILLRHFDLDDGGACERPGWLMPLLYRGLRLRPSGWRR